MESLGGWLLIKVMKVFGDRERSVIPRRSVLFFSREPWIRGARYGGIFIEICVVKKRDARDGRLLRRTADLQIMHGDYMRILRCAVFCEKKLRCTSCRYVWIFEARRSRCTLHRVPMVQSTISAVILLQPMNLPYVTRLYTLYVTAEKLPSPSSKSHKQQPGHCLISSSNVVPLHTSVDQPLHHR